MNSSRILLISGMHRCGTSFMANWLQQSGLFIGDRLAGATPSNIKGHFEDLDFLTWHEKVLHANNETMYMSKESVLTVPSPYKDQALRLVQERNQAKNEWGVKQPRASLFLEFWNDIMPTAHYIFMVREPSAVVNSILRREARKFLYKNDATIGPVKRQEYLEAKDEHAQNYESMYRLHCQRVLDFIEKQDGKKSLVVNFDNIDQQGQRLSERLNLWGFDLNLKPIDQVFSQKLLIEDKEYLYPRHNLKPDTLHVYHQLIKLSEGGE